MNLGRNPQDSQSPNKSYKILAVEGSTPIETLATATQLPPDCFYLFHKLLNWLPKKIPVHVSATD